MPNTIKYSTSGDTQSLKKGNFFIGVGDVPKGPSSRTNHWQGITPPTSGYTIYINVGSGSTAIMVPENDAKLVEYANGMNNNTNYFTNGGNFSNGTISPFNSLYNQVYGTSYVVNISNDKPYSGSNSNYAMFFNYGGGRMMGTDGMLTTGVTYTFSFWAKLLSGTTMNVSWNNQNGSGETNAWTSSATLTTEWRRYIQTFTYNLPRTRFYFSTANPSNPERAAIFTEFQVSTGTTYGGPGLQNATEALNWFSSVSQDEVCVNRDYEPIVTDGLILNVDGGFTPSYPRTGTTWYDLAYSGFNGTLTNGPIYSGANGGSLVFDGTDDYIDFGSNSSSLIQNKTAFTISTLFKLDRLDVLRPIFGTLAYGCGGNLGIVSSSGGLTFYNDYGPWPATGGTCYSVGFSPYVDVGQWVYAVATYDGARTIMYGIKNGTLSTTTGTTKTGVTNTFARNLRVFQGGGYVSKGSVISANLYNRVLSQSEILQNYRSYIPRLVNGDIVTNGLSLYLDGGYNGSYPTTGTTWYDVSGYGNNGTLTNGPTFNSANGGSIVLDGTNDYIIESSPSNLSNLEGNFTIEAFIKPTVSQYGNIVVLANSSFNLECQFIFTPSKVLVTKYGGTTLVSSTDNSVSLNNWYQVIYSQENNVGKIYINGSLNATSNVVPQTATVANVLLGTYATNSPQSFGGNYGIVRIYNRALTATEITQNYNAQKYRFGL
jgi:hypothetical protein